MLRAFLLVAAATILVAPGARAQAFYAGASFGESRLHSGDFRAEVQDAFGTLLLAYDAHARMGRSPAGRVFGGARLAPWLAIELDYADLGRTDTGYSSISIHGAIFGHSEASAGAKLDALGITAVARTAPWRSLSAFARAGIARTRSRGSSESCFFQALGHLPAVVTCSSADWHLSQTRPVAGLGLGYRLSDRWEARLGWDRYFGVGKTFDMDPASGQVTGRGKFDVDFLALGALYRF